MSASDLEVRRNGNLVNFEILRAVVVLGCSIPHEIYLVKKQMYSAREQPIKRQIQFLFLYDFCIAVELM